MKYLTRAEVARLTGLSYKSLDYYVWRYNVGERVSGHILWTQADVDRINQIRTRGEK